VRRGQLLSARLSLAWRDLAWLGLAWRGVVWRGVAWHSSARLDLARRRGRLLCTAEAVSTFTAREGSARLMAPSKHRTPETGAGTGTGTTGPGRPGSLMCAKRRRSELMGDEMGGELSRAAAASSHGQPASRAVRSASTLATDASTLAISNFTQPPVSDATASRKKAHARDAWVTPANSISRRPRESHL